MPTDFHRSFCDGSEEIVNLKTIQTITSIMQVNDLLAFGFIQLDLEHSEADRLLVEQAPTLLANLKVVFLMSESLLALHNSKNSSISNTAAAALRQSTSSLFERIDGECWADSQLGKICNGSDEPAIADLRRLCLENACALLREMCNLVDSGASKDLKFKPLGSAQTEWLCLEVVETCLRGHFRLFDQHEMLASVLRENTCAMVLCKLQAMVTTAGNKKDLVFGSCVRIMRVVAALLSHFPVGTSSSCLSKDLAKVVVLLRTMTGADFPLFHRTIALEVLFEFSARENFADRAKELHIASEGLSGDTVEKGVIGLIHSLERVIHRSLGVSRLPSASASAIAQAKSTLEALASGTDPTPKCRVLHILAHEPTAALATESACVDLALACLSNLVTALGKLCGIPCIPFDEECARQLANKPICDLEVLVQNVQVVRDVIDGAWEPILEALQTFMVSVLSPNILQRVLRAYTYFTQTCGALQLIGPRDRALAPLCKYALPTPAQEGSMAPMYSHHILMCKALLSLVLDLGGVLGETWCVVLEALQRLDSALVDRGYLPAPHSHSSPQKNSIPPDSVDTASSKVWSQGRLEAELVNLRATLDTIFEQTSSLDESTAIQLMSALCRVSLTSISDSRPDILPTSAAGKGERMFGVEKLVDIVKSNLFRVGRIWEPAANQLSHLGTHPRRSVRQYGMSTITQLVVLSFKYRADANRSLQSEEQALDSHARRRCSGDFDGSTEHEFDMERRLLSIFEELYRCQYVDTKNYVLDGLYTVLQACGEQVGPAWPMILAMLKGVAQDKESQSQDKEAQQIKRAFMCVQLVRNDLLSALPVDCLQLFLTTIGSFGLQDSDLNISLTAITLLWNIADFFGRERPALLAAFAAVGALSPPQSPAQGSMAYDLNKHDTLAAPRREVHNVDQLWLVLYQQLRYLAVDSRLEVRNSALRTLFTALETHGNVLEKDSWSQVVEELLLRVLDDVEQSALQSASDTPVERPLGPSTTSLSASDGSQGLQQMMLIHHSRNTLAKQWHVSWETALQGVMRMIMAFFGKVCQLDGRENVWSLLMEHFHSSILKGSEQVALSGMGAMKDLLCTTMCASPNATVLPQTMWQCFWKTMHSAVLALCDAPGYSLKALKGILTELGAIFESPPVAASGFFDKETLRLNIVLLDNIICALFTNYSNASNGPVVDAAVAGIMALARLIKTQQIEEELLWTMICNTMLQHLPDQQDRYSWWPKHISCFMADSNELSPVSRFIGPVMSTDLNCRLMLLVSSLFQSETPRPIQSLLLELLSAKFLSTMCTARYMEPHRELWRRASDELVQILKAGIPALRQCKRQSDHDKSRIWLGIARGLKWFILPDEGQVVSDMREGSDEAQRSEEVDIRLITFVAQDLLSLAPSTEIQKELLDIIDGGAAALQLMPTVSLSDSPVSFRFHLAEQSLDTLFSFAIGPLQKTSETIATSSSSSMDTARLAAPILVRRCWSILDNFVKDEAEASSCPLPRARTEQAVTTARRLHQLQLDPAICQHLFETFAASSLIGRQNGIPDLKDWGRSGRRGHLILLYSPLCRCICASNAALRDSVRACLELVGWELSIGNCS
jgi:hypothetical protein